MTTVFEVDTIFRIINRASPTLTAILKQVRELNLAIDKAKVNLASLGQANLSSASITTAIGETRALASAWADVSKNAATARGAMASAALAASRGTAAAVTGGGGGGRHRPPWLGGGGGHISGPGMPIPGGGHMRFGGGAAAAAGLLGYGAYQAAEMDDVTFQLMYHAGLPSGQGYRGKFKKIIEDAMVATGYSLKEIGAAANQELRMFQGAPGGGIDVLPEMLRASLTEARLKGTSPAESMTALIGLAHMTKQYSPDQIKKLAPAFAFLSTANPDSLGSIEKAAGYAVPLLQSGLEIDPMQTLLLGTALTRAGATSTKSGTWLREMALRAVPGTTLQSRVAYEKHESALQVLGLVDSKGKPTWFTDNKPDIPKMLEIAGDNAARIPLTERAGIERQIFGARGAGAFALLSDPAVHEQVRALRERMNSPEFRNRYSTFMSDYAQNSSLQQARTAVAEFNVTALELGRDVLPAVNVALKDFKGILEGIRNVLPGHDTGKKAAVVGGRAIEGAIGGAVAGGLYGLAGGPVGAVGGAVIGGAIGVAEGFMEGYNDKLKLGLDKGGTYTSPGKTGKPAEKIVVTPPVHLSLNLDGHLLAQAVSNALQSYYNFSTGAAAADGVGQPYLGEHNTTDN